MIFTPADKARDACDAEINGARERGRAEDDRWHLRQDGSIFWASGLMMRFEDERTGEHIGYLKVLRDRTRQHEADERMRASQELNSRVLQASPDCIKVLDLDARLEFMSEGGMCVMEVEDFEGIQGACWIDFWQGDEHIKAVHAVDEAKSGRTGRFQGFATTMKGNARWWDVIVTPINGPDGKPARLLSVSRDITAARQAEARLERRSNQLQQLAEVATNIARALTLEATLDEVTHAARRIIGAHQGVVSLTRGPDWSQAINSVALTDKYTVWKDYAEMPDGSGIYAWLCEENRPVRYNQAELEAHPRWRGFGRHADDHPPMRGWLAAPLIGRDGRNLGLIQLSDKEDGTEFDGADEAMLVQLAQLASAAVEQAQAETALAEQAAEFAALAENVSQLAWMAKPDGAIYWYNKRWYEYTGTTLEIMEGWGWREVHHPDYIDRVIGEVQANWARGEPWEGIYLLRSREGEYRSFLTRAEPIRNEAGELVRWFGTNTDITAQLRAEEQLRELAETLEQRVAERTAERDRIWSVSQDLFVICGFDGFYRMANPAWAEQLGYQPEELVGTKFDALVHPSDIEAVGGEFERLVGGEIVANFDIRLRARDGSFRWYSWTCVPEKDVFYAAGRDVTARKELEEQLRQSQKMEAVGQLTGGIAHDFNNLLTGVIGSLDMMQRRIAKGEMDRIERYATTAMASANRAAALTHRLLAFARRQPLDPKPVSSNRLVMGMEELLRRTIGEAVRLEIVTAGGLWRTLCDPHQLESAILNLAINARDAMPQGGKLTIETRNAHLDNAYAAQSRDVRPGQYVCISVTDTGTGMDKETITKAFEPFFTTKPIGQGTGLGLSMIYGFARQSEGYAKIYSEVGKGTTFKLYLPRYYGEGEDAGEVSGGLLEEHRSEHGEVVLVVEDEIAVRELVVDVLQELGYRAAEASDGLAGLKLLQSDMPVDLLVTDVGLPGLNGRQLADAARQQRPDLKVLFMTGYAENATLANGFLEPGMQMITKPFAIEALATRIRDMIEKEGS
jgi:PAS domain S-box-containing protein